MYKLILVRIILYQVRPQTLFYTLNLTLLSGFIIYIPICSQDIHPGFVGSSNKSTTFSQNFLVY